MKVGDLVINIKPQPCCGSTNGVGKIYTVKGLYKTRVYCGYCGTLYEDFEDLVDVGLQYGSILKSRLKVIDGGDLDEKISNDADVNNSIEFEHSN
jgi:hypothetical protein